MADPAFEMPTMNEARLYLRLLGGFSLQKPDGAIVKLPTLKSRLLLAYLAMSPGQPHARSKLASLFWGDTSDEQARGSLRNALSAIRIVLGRNNILSSGDAVTLRPGILMTDVAALEAAGHLPGTCEVLEQWTGQFLEACDFSSDEFDLWLGQCRSRCHELVQAAFETGVKTHASAGNWSQAMLLAQLLVSLDPYREQSHRLLMSVLAQSGERSKALEQYETLVRLLAAELAVEPSEQSKALADSIASGSTINATPRVQASLEADQTVAIAVLPFTNFGDDAQDYFADGICEDIMTAMSKSSGLRVIARTSSLTYKGKAIDYRDVRERLGVRYFLEGSVRRLGSRVRINATLIDTASGSHVWAERYDREIIDVFDVQDDVAQHIATALAIELDAGTGEHTAVIEAYEYFLRGRQLIWRFQHSANAHARDLFARAIDLDPNFAPAHSFLGLTHSSDYVNGWTDDPDRTLDLALHAVEKSLKLDPSYPYGHWSRAGVRLWQRRHDEAFASARRVLELSPGFAEGYAMLGFVLHYSGQSEKGLSCFDKSMRLDPCFPDLHLHFRGQSLFQLKRYAEAIEVLQRRLVRNPDTDISRVLLASCHGHLGHRAAARAEWDEVYRVNPHYSLDYRRRVLPYKDPADFEHIVEGIRKAGISV